MDIRRRMMLATLGGGTPLSDLPVGSILKILEGGVLTDFYVAKHNYESRLNGAGRTLLVRKDCHNDRPWDSSNVNAWENCNLRYWLNGDYLNLLDEDIRGVIGTTKYYYTPGSNKTVTTRSDAVFQLSVTELGKTDGNVNTEGSALPIASSLQIAYRNGSAVIQWTRSPSKTSTNLVSSLRTNGNTYFYACSKFNGSRPAFTLPADALCKPNADGSFTLSI